uniref:Uncharacterized protein n=1 Tax=Timema genevievae TaxID=629358 RepID=A0A7R9PR48_TIMGE|nr:unnamed protein product [Timema genevievae]
MVVKTNLEELTPASPLQVPSSSKQTTITPPIEALVKPQKPESIKVVLPIHPEMESTDKLQSRKTDEQQEQKKEPVLSTPESSSVESVKPSLAEQAPVPPKRRGAKGDSGKATVSQPSKGSKTGQKGKK